MSYAQEAPNKFDIGGTAEDLSASGAVFGEIAYSERVKVKRLMFLVTTTVAADSTAPVVEFNKRVTPKSATGEVALGTLTIPDGTVAGTVIYKDIDPVEVELGESIAFEHTVQADDSGSAAGAGYYMVEVLPCEEYILNEAAATASV